jgi:hypothetical protein
LLLSAPGGDHLGNAGNRQQTAAENVIGHRGYIERRVLIRFERADATGAMIYANPMGYSSRPSILSNANLVRVFLWR